MRTYEVILSREGKWWMVSIPESNGLTQAQRPEEAGAMAREYIAVTLDLPMDSFGIDVKSE